MWFLWHLFVSIVVGGIIGWLASILMKTNKQTGIIVNVIVGIVGAVLGRWCFRLLGIGAYGLVGRVVISVLGAVLLIAILKAMKILK